MMRRRERLYLSPFKIVVLKSAAIKHDIQSNFRLYSLFNQELISMAEWSMGYQTDLQYTFGYFRMNNPLYARYLFTSQGLAFPRMGGGWHV